MESKIGDGHPFVMSHVFSVELYFIIRENVASTRIAMVPTTIFPIVIGSTTRRLL